MGETLGPDQGVMKSLMPEGVILPEDPVPAETGAQPLTQEQIDAINKLALEKGTTDAAAAARGMLIQALG